MGFRNPGDEHHAEPYEKYYHSGTEGRLEQYQDKRHKRIKAGNKNMFDVSNLHMPAGKIFGQNKNEHQFYHVSRLKRKNTQRKPAFCAINSMPYAEQKYQ